MARRIAVYNSGSARAGVELFATDGTAAGTALVRDVQPGPGSGNPVAITPIAAGGAVFVAADGPAVGRQLFVTDGTANGTVELLGTFLSVARPALRSFEPVNSSLADLVPFGQGALFAGATAPGAVQLWFTDGTRAGTRAVRDFGPSESVALDGIVSLAIPSLGGGRAVFDLGAGASEPGLWGTDGTAAGTVRLSASAPVATALGNGLALTVLDSGFAATARTAVLGVTDGTVAGTRTLQTFTGIYAYAPVGGLTAIGGGRALFNRQTAANANELWVSDGTAAGTARLVASSSFATANYAPLGDGRTLFSVADAADGPAIWVTDGTAAGTAPVANLGGLLKGTITGITPLGGGRALLADVDYATGRTLVVATDGTAAGTRALVSFPGFVNGFGTQVLPLSGFAALGDGRGVFTVLSGGSTTQVWAADGTAAALLASYPSRAGISPGAPTALGNGRATFNVSDAAGFSSLYATDGTAAGTGPIAAAPGQIPVSIAAADNNPGAAPGTGDPLFDAGYYLAHNPDVAASGIDPYQHYLLFGGFEGRNPDAFFDSRLYLAQGPDVAAAKLNPLLHYEQFGYREGREPSLVFSGAKYLAANPDVAANGGGPLLHFVQYGAAEGRSSFLAGPTALPAAASGTFYSNLVMTQYYEAQLGGTLLAVPAAGGATQAAASYDAIGWQRGLNPDALFDTNYYLSRNADVAAAGINPLLHFVLFGGKEGRDPSAAFSTGKYLAANPDVARSGTNALVHYLLGAGQAEGRAIYPV